MNERPLHGSLQVKTSGVVQEATVPAQAELQTAFGDGALPVGRHRQSRSGESSSKEQNASEQLVTRVLPCIMS